MKSIAGIFMTREQAEGAFRRLEAAGIPTEKLVLLTPSDADATAVNKNKTDEKKASSGERDMGKVTGALVGSAVAAGVVGGPLLAAIPGVGPVVVVGLMGAALLGAAGAGAGAAIGGKLEKHVEKTEPESLADSEIFLYEDSLRRGRSIVAVIAEDSRTDLATINQILTAEGGQTVDAAREQWWHDLRKQAKDDYGDASPTFERDEKFYRQGFEAALNANARHKPQSAAFDEMNDRLRELQANNPGVEVADPFSRGYNRGREYYEQVVAKTRAA